ncbi:chemotaxis protein CheW [Melittangium boletus]|uniref:chemotaxis protein CheW n=1 Tax=Melittangium boletus TaxID=83453 RepID=UPI003DA3654A
MSRPLVRVHTGGQRWLVRVEDLQEVVPMMALTRVAGQRGGCRGLLNLRGELVPVFDGNGGEAPLVSTRLILVLRERAGARVGLIVDEARDVLFLSDAELSARPVGGGRMCHVALVDGALFTLLEPDEVAAHGA